jgi:hypothetical protein
MFSLYSFLERRQCEIYEMSGPPRPLPSANVARLGCIVVFGLEIYGKNPAPPT